MKRSSSGRYWAVSTGTAGRHFEREFDHRVSASTDALAMLETAPTTTEQRGVRTVAGRDTVAERVVDFAETADEEVPEAEPFESPWDWSDTPAGRLLVVDQEKARERARRRQRWPSA